MHRGLLNFSIQDRQKTKDGKSLARRTPTKLLTTELFIEETTVSLKLWKTPLFQSPISELQTLGLISARPTMPPGRHFRP